MTVLLVAAGLVTLRGLYYALYPWSWTRVDRDTGKPPNVAMYRSVGVCHLVLVVVGVLTALITSAQDGAAATLWILLAVLIALGLILLLVPRSMVRSALGRRSGCPDLESMIAVRAVGLFFLTVGVVFGARDLGWS